MSRVVIISFFILTALLWFGVKAKREKQQVLSTALFTAAAVYTIIMLLSFGGLISGT